MKIILAIDGSDHSKLTIGELAERPFPPKTEVHIISVYTQLSKMATFETLMGAQDYYTEINQIALKSSTNIIKEATKIMQIGNPGLVITSAVLEGLPAKIIIQEADAFGADLIVVGSHGQSGLSSFLLGSVSQSVALHANCSVEIVRKGGLKKEIINS